MVALISNDYLRSKVCMEELSLAIELERRGDCKIYPLLIESPEEKIDWLNLLSPIQCFDKLTEEEKSGISGVCKKIIRDIKGALECTSFFIILPRALV